MDPQAMERQTRILRNVVLTEVGLAALGAVLAAVAPAALQIPIRDVVATLIVAGSLVLAWTALGRACGGD